MSGIKKSTSAPMLKETRNYLMSLSKAALADCLWDALTLVADNAEPTEQDAKNHCEPRLIVRGDRRSKKGNEP